MAGNSNANDFHVDQLLTNMSLAFMQDEGNFVSHKVGTNLPVNKASNKYTVYPQGYWNKIYDSHRGEEAVANTITHNVKDDNYSIGEKALRSYISRAKEVNADQVHNLDVEAVALVNNALLLGEEIDFRDKFLVTGQWGQDLTGVASSPGANQFLKWSDPTSDPVGDFKKYRREFFLRSGGRKINRLEITLDVWDSLTEHPDIKSRIKTTGANQPAIITRQAIAALFEVDEINVISTIINTATDGVEDGNGDVPVNNTFTISNVMLAHHVAPNAGLMTPTSIINFYLPTYTGSDLAPRFTQYPGVEGKQGRYVEGELRVERKMVASDLGQLWTGIL